MEREKADNLALCIDKLILIRLRQSIGAHAEEALKEDELRAKYNLSTALSRIDDGEAVSVFAGRLADGLPKSVRKIVAEEMRASGIDKTGGVLKK